MDVAAPSLVNAGGAAPRRADPCAFVIFGAAGDLTKRLLLPALYNLASQQLLSREFAVIGVGRTAMSDDDARKKLSEEFKKFATGPVDAKLWDWFLGRISYVSGDFDDPATYEKLKQTLAKVDQEHNSHGNYFFYMAAAPKYARPVAARLHEPKPVSAPPAQAEHEFPLDDSEFVKF